MDEVFSGGNCGCSVRCKGMSEERDNGNTMVGFGVVLAAVAGVLWIVGEYGTFARSATGVAILFIVIGVGTSSTAGR